MTLALLPASCRWWRYPVRPPNPRTLDYTRRKGALYPVRRFTKAECAAYVPDKAKEGHKGRLKEKIGGKRWAFPKGMNHVQWTIHAKGTTPDPARYFKTSYGARSTDGTLSRWPKFCGATQHPYTGECRYQNKEWERWPESSRVTYHDRLEKNAKENKPLLFVGVRPDITELRHRRAVPLVVGMTSDGAALTWSQSQTNHPLIGHGSRLVLPGVWTFVGAERHYSERWKFTEAPKPKGRPVPPSFKGERKRVQNLPARRGPARIYLIKGKEEGFRPAHFRWKPDRQHYFGAWEQHRYVRWTRTPRPSMADLGRFIARK